MAIRREDAALLRIEAAVVATPAASVPAPAPAQAVTPAPRRIDLRRARSWFTGTLWLVGGAGVLGYAAALVYANVARVEVDSAVVTGPVQPLRAPAAGMLAALPVAVGDRFAPGDTLAVLRSPELEQAIGLAGARLERARQELAQREQERAAEQARREAAMRVARAELDRIGVEVAALETIEQQARGRFDAIARLHEQGIAVRMRLDEAAARVGEARSSVARERIRLTEREAALAQIGIGAGELGLRLADAEAAAQRARVDLAQAAQELGLQEARRGTLAIAAPAPGRILRLLRTDGSQVLAGETIAIMEAEEERLVHAFLTQSEIGRVAIGDAADVMLPAQRLAARARVIAVERSGAYLDDVESRYQWSLARDTGQRLTDRDRSARVTLRFEGDDAAAARQVLHLGTPAVVSFERRWRGGTMLPAFAPLAGAGTGTGPAAVVAAARP